MTIGYGALKRFGPADGDTWSDYISCIGFPHLKEVVSLDGQLCPNLIDHLSDEDWQHNLVDDDLFFYFRDLDYFLSRFDVPVCYQVLAVVKNPAGSEKLDDPRFEFIGFDLTEAGFSGGISALTNCGGFGDVFGRADINEYGLVSTFSSVTEISRLLREKYPDEPHVYCNLYAVWRMKGKGTTERSNTRKASQASGT